MGWGTRRIRRPALRDGTGRGTRGLRGEGVLLHMSIRLTTVADVEPDDGDGGDFGVYQRCCSGAGKPGDPNCAN